MHVCDLSYYTCSTFRRDTMLSLGEHKVFGVWAYYWLKSLENETSKKNLSLIDSIISKKAFLSKSANFLKASVWGELFKIDFFELHIKL